VTSDASDAGGRWLHRARRVAYQATAPFAAIAGVFDRVGCPLYKSPQCAELGEASWLVDHVEHVVNRNKLSTNKVETPCIQCGKEACESAWRDADGYPICERCAEKAIAIRVGATGATECDQ